MNKVELKPEAAKFIRRRAYTLYSKWIEERFDITQGSFVEFSLDGEVVARGFYERIGAIGGRILAYVSENDSNDLEEIILWRLEEAWKLRMAGGERKEEGFRLLYADSDGTPGLIVDIFGGTAVVQSSSYGWDRSSEMLAEKMVKLGISERVFLKNDQRGRKSFGLPIERRFLVGGPPPEEMIEENGFRISVNFGEGQKSGYYLDQKEARKRIYRMDLSGIKALDLFSYTGSFSLSALGAGASYSLLVDEDERALAIASRNMELNGFEGKFGLIRGRVEKVLDWLKAKRRKFDFIIADPPAMIPNPGAKEKGMKAYEKLFQNAISVLEPGGFLYASSCSYPLGEKELLRILRMAASERGYTMRVLFHLSPYNAIPYVRAQDEELLYLKGFLIKLE